MTTMAVKSSKAAAVFFSYCDSYLLQSYCTEAQKKVVPIEPNVPQAEMGCV